MPHAQACETVSLPLAAGTELPLVLVPDVQLLKLGCEVDREKIYGVRKLEN